ncbi:hypothetical protein IW140_001908 [Coemansia sp. RSA 1813]|nr:hypothetical protein EV178_005075 [Coemansia sp. RSA 1646]KAJ1769909.1 hypothetical protein LPJ74_003630 [Coemansia sp. RSA 1843]KAJ2087247.1 hypothetical protein IW138_005093 [Coemansia sp. RSA 986]KAJ2212091.1 hypothetical protein EV179_004953 [Coemansia sp. RSA 487]KAJ2570954.1 hypothetical protein IW140_001908 [Coemansia sp. RSA 1813]
MVQTVAIVGATGFQGGSVLRALHGTGKYKLVAVTRDTSSTLANDLKNKYPDVELVAANLDNIEPLKKAFEGADFVFGVTQFFQPGIRDKIDAGNFDVEYKQGKNIVDAAISVGVKNIIFSSLPSMKAISGGKYPIVHQFEGKYRVEEYLKSKANRINGAIIHLGSYMENFVNFARISTDDNKTIEFTFPYSPDAPLPLADVSSDTGAVVSHMLDHFHGFVGKTVVVSSGYYSSQDMVDAFTEATGKPARYVQIPHAYFNGEDLEQMFKGIEEFGMFNGSTDFLEFNKALEYKFTTPVEFWENRGWTGPTKS